MCAGLFRAASTWAFNVTAEVARRGGAIARMIFAEDVATIAAQVDQGMVIVKSHNPAADMRLLVNAAKLTTIISVRDPLDCVASLMERFGETYEKALADVVDSTHVLLATIEATPDALVLRYEDVDARGPSDVQRIAEHLGTVLLPASIDEIAERYGHVSVRAHIDALEASGVFDNRPPRNQYDAETHWHPGHLGSGASGRHNEVLSPGEAIAVAYATRRFRERMDYTLPARRIAPASRLAFSREALAYCERGFDRAEHWGLWTAEDRAILHLPLAGQAQRVRLTLHCLLAPVFRSGARASVRISTNGMTLAEIAAEPKLPERLIIALVLDAGGAQDLELAFDFAGLLEVDPRRLGLGLLTIEVNYDPYGTGHDQTQAAERPTS